MLRVPKAEFQQIFNISLPRGYAHENSCGGPRDERAVASVANIVFDIEVISFFVRRSRNIGVDV